MKTVRVGDISDQIRGVTYSKADARQYGSAGFSPILRAGNIGEFGLVFDDLVFVPDAKISEKQRIRRHDVVIATSSGSLDVVGKAAQALDDFPGGFGAFCKVLRPGEEVDPKYFGHFFRTGSYRRSVTALAAGANINNLRTGHLDDLQIPVPPLPEQKRIAAILDAADALRAKRRESLELLDKLVQSVFLDMFGDPVTNPKGLPTKPLYEVAPLQRGFDLPVGKRRQGGVPVLASNGPVGFHDEPKVRGPGVVTGRSGTLGKVKFIQRDFWPLNTTLWVTDFHGNEPRWIAQLLELFRFDRFSRGVGVPTLNRNLVHVEHVPVPPVPEQIKFAEIWQAQEVHRNRLESHLAALDTLFASLQSRAFRGEL